MSRTRRASVAASCILAFTLTGCGGGSEPSSETVGSSDSSKDSPEGADAATGDTIEGTGFSFNAPDGWTKGDASQLPSVNVLALATDPKDDDGFSDNINVLEDPTIVDAPADQLEQGLKSALGNVADEVTIGDPITVDGEDAVVVLATYKQYKTVQQVVQHGGKGYIVTYSFSSDVSPGDQLDLAASVAAGWKWAS